MKVVTGLLTNADDEAEEREEQNQDISKRNKEDSRKTGWLDRSGLRVEYRQIKEQRPQHRKSRAGLVTGLSRLKPILPEHTTDDTFSSDQIVRRLLQILGMMQKTPKKNQQELDLKTPSSEMLNLHPSAQHQHLLQQQQQLLQQQQQEKMAGLHHDSSDRPPQKSTNWKMPPSSIRTYVTQLLSKPKLFVDLRLKIESMGLKNLNQGDLEEALRQILKEASKADKEQGQRSGANEANYPWSNRAGYGYPNKGQAGETVSMPGAVKGPDLYIIGDHIYSGHSLGDSDAPTVRHEPPQKLGASRPGPTSPKPQPRETRRTPTEMTSEARSHPEGDGKLSRKTSGERLKRRGSGAGGEKTRDQRTRDQRTGEEDFKKRKIPEPSAKSLGLTETVDRGKRLGSGSEPTSSGYQRLFFRLSRASKGAIDEYEKKISQRRSKTTGVDASTKSSTQGLVSAALPSQVRIPRKAEAAEKDEEAVTMVTPQVKELTMDVVPEERREMVPEATRKVVPEMRREVVPEMRREVVPEMRREVVPEMRREVVPEMRREVVPEVVKHTPKTRPASSPLEEAAKDLKGDLPRPTARSQTPMSDELLQLGMPVVTRDQLVRDRSTDLEGEGPRKDPVQKRAGKSKGVALHPSATKTPLADPAKETDGGKSSGSLTPSPGSAQDKEKRDLRGKKTANSNLTPAAYEPWQRISAGEGSGAASLVADQSSGEVLTKDKAHQDRRRPMKVRKNFVTNVSPVIRSSPVSESVISPTGSASNLDSTRPTLDRGELTQGYEESPTTVVNEVSPTEKISMESHIDTGPTEAQTKAWSTVPPKDIGSAVVSPPPRRLFIAKGDHYGLPEEGFELTRAFVFSYFRPMPIHYFDFKSNPPIVIATKKTKKKKKK